MFEGNMNTDPGLDLPGKENAMIRIHVTKERDGDPDLSHMILTRIDIVNITEVRDHKGKNVTKKLMRFLTGLNHLSFVGEIEVAATLVTLILDLRPSPRPVQCLVQVVENPMNCLLKLIVFDQL